MEERASSDPNRASVEAFVFRLEQTHPEFFRELADRIAGIEELGEVFHGRAIEPEGTSSLSVVRTPERVRERTEDRMQARPVRRAPPPSSLAGPFRRPISPAHFSDPCVGQGRAVPFKVWAHRAGA